MLDDNFKYAKEHDQAVVLWIRRQATGVDGQQVQLLERVQLKPDDLLAVEIGPVIPSS